MSIRRELKKIKKKKEINQCKYRSIKNNDRTQANIERSVHQTITSFNSDQYHTSVSKWLILIYFFNEIKINLGCIMIFSLNKLFVKVMVRIELLNQEAYK